jgi:hypothetical protein
VAGKVLTARGFHRSPLALAFSFAWLGHSLYNILLYFSTFQQNVNGFSKEKIWKNQKLSIWIAMDV